MNKAEPTLALKPRGDVTSNPKQGYQWPQNRICVRQKHCVSWCSTEKLKKDLTNNRDPDSGEATGIIKWSLTSEEKFGPQRTPIYII